MVLVAAVVFLLASILFGRGEELPALTSVRRGGGCRPPFPGFARVRGAASGRDDGPRLMAAPSIVRNGAKIDAAINTAAAVAELDTPLDELLWSFAPDPAGRPRPATLDEVPAVTPESKAMAKELKRRGFTFVGPTTCYAMMQATGMVDDHIATCWRAGGQGRNPREAGSVR